MASLRGATTVWSSTSIDTGDESPPAYVPGDKVAVYISNEGANSHTFKIQVADSGNDKGGLNEYDHSLDDGGMVWYDYVGGDALTVGNAEKKCWDFSPFAPQLVRIVCTAGTANAITAIITSYGPN